MYRFWQAVVAALSFCMAANSIAASHHGMAKSPFDGFYTGVGLGSGSTQFAADNSSTYTSTRVPQGDTQLIATSRMVQGNQSQSFAGEFDIGYGRVFAPYAYFGLVGFIDIAGHSNHLQLNVNHNVSGNPILDFKSTAVQLSDVTGGLALKPGVLVAPQTLFYAVLGWQHGGARLSATQTVRITTGLVNNATATNQNYRGANGLRLGFGFAQQISRAVTLGISYVYTDYLTKFKVSSSGAATGPTFGGPYSYALNGERISTQAVLANVTYYWGRRSQFSHLLVIKPEDFNGMYVAPQIGALNPSVAGGDSVLAAVYFDQGAFINTPELIGTIPGDSAATLLSLAAGFGHIFWRHIYLGIEGSVDWRHHNIQSDVFQGFRPVSSAIAGQAQDSIAHQAIFKMWDLEPSVDVKAGVLLFKRLLGYFKVGVAVNRVNLEVSDRLTFLDDNSNSQTVNLNVSTSNAVKANVQAGMGLEFQFAPHNTFSLNYLYTYYGQIGVNHSATANDTAGNPTTISDVTRATLFNNSLTIGFSHYFG